MNEMVAFSREANLNQLRKQLELTKEYMEMASKSYSELQKALSLFRNFVTVGVPLDASLNELSNLKTKALEMREQHIRDLQGTRATASESIEEDSATHSLRPKIVALTPPGSNGQGSAPSSLSIPASINVHLWSRETTLDTTSFRQQLRSLQLNTATTRLFRKCFVDANLSYVSFIGEKRSYGSSTSGSSMQLSSSSSNEEASEHTEPLVITFEKKKAEKSDKSLESSSGGSSYRLQDTSNSLLLIHSITGDTLMQHTAITKAKDMMDVLLRTPQMADFELSRISDSSGEFTKNLLALESRMANTNYKVGVLYIRAGQTKEEDYFANHCISSSSPATNQHTREKDGSAPNSVNFSSLDKSEKVSSMNNANHTSSNGGPFSREYEQFLKLLGDKVELQGWQNFSGGLDTRDNRNGTHSIFSVLDGGSASIMFHVATMMPYDPEDEDGCRIERKKHIGNDVVCVVFVEEGGYFNPLSLRSEFVHVYLVVQPTTVNNRTYYKVECVTRNGVSRFGPSLPNCLFPHSKLFSLFLLTKIVNADIASTSAPAFQKRITRTREALLGDLVAVAKTKKWIKRNSVATAPSLQAMTAAVTASALASGSISNHGSSLTSSSASKVDRLESSVREKGEGNLTASSSPREPHKETHRDPHKELHKETSTKSLGPRAMKHRSSTSLENSETDRNSNASAGISVTSSSTAPLSGAPEKSPSKKSLGAAPLRPRDKTPSSSDLSDKIPRPPRSSEKGLSSASTADSLLSPSPVSSSSSSTRIPKKRESFDTRHHSSSPKTTSDATSPKSDLKALDSKGSSSAASTTEDIGVEKKPKKSASRRSVSRDDLDIKPNAIKRREKTERPAV